MPDQASRPPSKRLALVVAGVSGSGKSTIGVRLAEALGLPFVDGDTLHPAENVAHMAAGIALTDADRWPWLDRVGVVLADRAAFPAGVVVACSALRCAYRDRLRAAEPRALFAFLDATPEAMARRLAARTAHFMPASLVDSQFAALERPVNEPGVLVVPEGGTVAESVARILTFANRANA